MAVDEHGAGAVRPWSSDAPDHPHGVTGGLETPGTSNGEPSGSAPAPTRAARCTSPAQVASALTLGVQSSSQSSLSCVAFPAGQARGANDMLDGALRLATPASDWRFFQAEGRLSPLRVAQDAPPPADRRGAKRAAAKLDFEACRWFDRQMVAAVTVRGVSAMDGFFAASRPGGARVALAEGAVRHRLVAVFAGGCAPGGRRVHFPGAGVARRSVGCWTWRPCFREPWLSGG